MTLDAERALCGALLARLAADPTLAGLVGTRMHDSLPRNPSYPYLAISRLETRPISGEGSNAREHIVSLMTVTRFGGPTEVRAINAAARAALHNAALVLPDLQLISLRVTYADGYKAADGRQDYGVLRLRAVTEPQ